MARDATTTIILYVGGFIILYSILRSWGIIQPTSMSTSPNWKPLTLRELTTIRNYTK